ncbi:MAG TPA: plastocyanin/azurin family copper-binding protein [Myxococcus sp.]|nr:plastocyanin/azurin family copper-binding protein [Myxococcus sp.]
MRDVRWWTGLGLVGALLLAGCEPVADNEERVTIFDFHYSPAHVRVKPGETVRVLNMDTAPHSVTSAPAAGRLVPGKSDGIAFDTGAFMGEERTFTVPADAAPGAVVPFFCTVHHDFQHGVGRLIVE